jgi:NAD(P)-dependent dehydrogenase (short-subunit alcohol dehydrogenase family)
MPFAGASFSALVLGASGGIGAAMTGALRAHEGCEKLVTLSRSNDGIDLANEDCVAAAASRLSGVKFDFIFNGVGVLEVDGAGPEKSFGDIDGETMMRAFAVNAAGAALVFKYFLPLLNRDGPAIFATLSARVGSIGDNRLGGWMSYRASKAALNQIVRCAAIEETRRNKESVIVALHPGTIETPLTQKYAKGRYTAEPQECATNLLSVLADLTPQHSGGFFDYSGKEVAW